MNNLVSVIIPTKNSSKFLENCLISIKKQTYKDIEVIIVDGKSTDETRAVAKVYNCKLYTFVPKVKKGLFDATPKRNYGGKMAKGDFLYFVDADMILSKNVITESVHVCITKKIDAVIIPEDSFGQGPWAKAKNLERRFYWNDDGVESPRFFRKNIWEKLGGYDETIAGGGDDRDLYQKAIEQGCKVQRITSMVLSNEGKPTFWGLMKKQFMYKQEILHYMKKRPIHGIKSYFPFRRSHIENFGIFFSRPKDTFFLFIMKSGEIIGSIAGIFYAIVKR